MGESKEWIYKYGEERKKKERQKIYVKEKMEERKKENTSMYEKRKKKWKKNKA